MRCRLVGYGTPKSDTQSAMRSFAVDHMTPSSAIYDESGNVIATHAHKGDFKEW
jgi:hypothetical protein